MDLSSSEIILMEKLSNQAKINHQTSQMTRTSAFDSFYQKSEFMSKYTDRDGS